MPRVLQPSTRPRSVSSRHHKRSDVGERPERGQLALVEEQPRSGVRAEAGRAFFMRFMLAIFMFSTACGGGGDTSRDDNSRSTGPTPFSIAAAAAKPKPKPIDLALGEGYQMRYPIRDGNLPVVPN